MKLSKNVAISESGLLFNPVTGESFTVNPIGVEIINALKEDRDPQSISDDILGKYSTDRSTFEKDYQDFIGMLIHFKLLEHNEPTKA